MAGRFGWVGSARSSAAKRMASANANDRIMGEVGRRRISRAGGMAMGAGRRIGKHPVAMGAGLGMGMGIYAALPTGSGRSSGSRGTPQPRSMGGYA
jgi:hypothetical protein